jgi:CHAD domain-containing protein
MAAWSPRAIAAVEEFTMTRSLKKLQPEMPVTVAARIMLVHQLRQAQRRLKRAARKAGKNVKHVHRLRISTRRAIAALDAFKELLPRKLRKQVADHLKQVRNVAANARDLDVLIDQRCNDQQKDRKLIKNLRKKRNRAQKPIIRVYHRFGRSGKLERDCHRLLKTLDRLDVNDYPTYYLWARRKLAEYVGTFFAQEPVDVASPKRLHRFRIAVKKLRYAIGAVEPAFPPRSFADIKPLFKRLQDLLGKINDRAVAISRIRKMQADGLDVSQSVISRELDGLEQGKQEFASWWTPAQSRAMKESLERLIGEQRGDHSC